MPYAAPPHTAPDAPIIQPNTDFLDFHLYSPQPHQDRIMWHTEKAQLGLFVQDQLPYILVHFPKHEVTFDCSFNIRQVPDEIRTKWFLSDRAIVGLILASYPTNHYYGMQRITVGWAAELRRVSRLTISEYPTTNAIESQQRVIENRFSTAQMWQQCWHK